MILRLSCLFLAVLGTFVPSIISTQLYVDPDALPDTPDTFESLERALAWVQENMGSHYSDETPGDGGPPVDDGGPPDDDGGPPDDDGGPPDDDGGPPDDDGGPPDDDGGPPDDDGGPPDDDGGPPDDDGGPPDDDGGPPDDDGDPPDDDGGPPDDDGGPPDDDGGPPDDDGGPPDDDGGPPDDDGGPPDDDGGPPDDDGGPPDDDGFPPGFGGPGRRLLSGLEEVSVIITLKASAVGHPQVFSIQQYRMPSLLINFENDQIDVSNQSDCENLPTIHLKRSDLDIRNLSIDRATVIMQSVEFSPAEILLSYIGSFTLTNSCLKSISRQNAGLPIFYELAQIESIQFENWINIMEYGTSLIFSVSKSLILRDGKTLLTPGKNTSSLTPSSYTIYEIKGRRMDVTLELTNHLVRADDNFKIITKIFDISDMFDASLTGLHFQDCYFGKGEIPEILTTEGITNLNIDGLNLENITVNIPAFGSYTNEGLIRDISTPNLTITNTEITDLNFLTESYQDYSFYLLELVSSYLLERKYAISRFSLERANMGPKTGLIFRTYQDDPSMEHNESFNFSNLRLDDVAFGKESVAMNFRSNSNRNNPEILSNTTHLFENFEIVNCDFYESKLLIYDSADRTALELSISQFIMENITIANMDHFIIPSRTKDQYLLIFYNALNVSLANMTLNNVVFNQTSTEKINALFRVDFYDPPARNASFKIANFLIDGLQSPHNTQIISYANEMFELVKYNTFEIIGFTLKDIDIRSGSLVIQFLYTWATFREFYVLERSPNIALIQDLKIIDCEFHDSSLVSFHKTDAIPKADNGLNFILSDAYIAGNHFEGETHRPLIYLESFLSINNLTMINNTLQDYNLVYSRKPFFTFFMKDSSFKDDRFINSSIIDLTTQPTVTALTEAEYKDEANEVLARAWPLIMLNCSFDNLTLTAQSTLMVANNPQIILVNNTMINMNVTESVVFQSPEIVKPEHTEDKSYLRYTELEDKLFEQAEGMQAVYSAAYTDYSSQWPESEVLYFRVFKGNSVRNYTGMNIPSVYESSNFVEQSMFVFENNHFDNVLVNSSGTQGLLVLSDSTNSIIRGNSYVNVKGKGTFVSVQEYSGDLLIEKSNISDILVSSSLTIRSQSCRGLKLRGDEVRNIDIGTIWISISCLEILETIEITNSHYTNVSLSDKLETSGLQEDLNLLRVDIDLQKFDGVGLLVQGNVFDLLEVQTEQRLILNNAIYHLFSPQSPLVLKNNSFLSLTPASDELLMAIEAMNVTIMDSHFKNITYTAPSRAFKIVTKEKLLIENVIFEDIKSNSGNGNGLFAFSDSSHRDKLVAITMKDCVFRRNIAASGTVLTVEYNKLHLIVDNCTFEDNVATQSAAIHLIAASTSQVQVSNSYFGLHNKLNIKNHYEFLRVEGCLDAIDVQIDDSTLDVSGSFDGSFLELSNNDEVRLNMTSIRYYATIQENSSPTARETNAQISGSSFGLLRADRVEATIQDITVLNISLTLNPLFELRCTADENSLYYGSLNITNGTFHNLWLDKTIIALASTPLSQGDVCPLSLTVTASNFSTINSEDKGAVISAEPAAESSQEDYTAQIVVEDCTFRNITADYGPIISMEGEKKNSEVVFSSNHVNGSQAKRDGGMFYVHMKSLLLDTDADTDTLPERLLASSSSPPSKDLTVRITDNQLTSVTGENGGVIFAQGLHLIDIRGNSIKSSGASKRGGVVSTDTSPVELKNNSFDGISAEIDGVVLFSESIAFNFSEFYSSNEMVQAPSSQQVISFPPNSMSVSMSSIGEPIGVSKAAAAVSANSDTITFTNLTSYSLSKVFVAVQLEYKEDGLRQVVIDESPDILVEMVFYITDQEPRSFVTTNCTRVGCSAIPSTVTLAGKADEVIRVQVIYTSQLYSQQTDFYVQLRGCLPGEINATRTNECVLCGEGTFSIDPADSECQTCSENAICRGGNQIVAKENHWRSEAARDQVVPCEHSDGRCLGGAETNCIEKYRGAKCAQCNVDEGYNAQGPGMCSSCPSADWLRATGAMLVSAMICYQLVLTFITLRENNKVHNERLESVQSTFTTTTTTAASNNNNNIRTGAYVVILTTYAQITSILGKFELGYITELLGLSVSIGNPNKQVLFSLECLYYSLGAQPLQAMQLKLYFYVLSPFAKLLAWGAIELLLRLVRGSKHQNMLVRVGAVAVVLTLLEQPGIISSLCSYLSCSRLDPFSEDEYITANNDVRCHTPEYDQFRNRMVIPSLVVWAAVIPLVIGMVLYNNKKRLPKSKPLRLVLGSFYNNYNQEGYYWGVFIMVFKIVLFVLDAVVEVEATAKAFMFILLIYGYGSLLRGTEPHLHKSLYMTEDLTVVSYVVTLSLIMIKLTVSNAVVENLCDFFIIAINVLALGNMLIGKGVFTQDYYFC